MASPFEMYQGDQFNIELQLKSLDCSIHEYTPISLDGVELIEFTIGSLSKNWPDEVTYDPETCIFYFPVTQQESFSMSVGIVEFQSRIVWEDGHRIRATPIGKIDVNETLSKNII